jgi:hypothetical protein
VINTLMSNNTRIVTTNVTCEITAFDLNVCRQDFNANVTEIIADKNEEIEEMKISSERELEIDKDAVIDSFTMECGTCPASIDECRSTIVFQTFPCATSWFVTRCVRLAVRRST